MFQKTKILFRTRNIQQIYGEHTYENLLRQSQEKLRHFI